MEWSRRAITTGLLLALAACSSGGGSTTQASQLGGGRAVPQSATSAAGPTTAASSPSGGSSEITSGSQLTGASTSPPGESTEATAAADGISTTTAASGGPTTTVPAQASSTTVLGGPAESAYCNAFIAFKDAETVIDMSFNDVTSTTQELAAAFSAVDVLMAAAEAAAPAEIHADVASLAAPRRQLIQFVASHGYDLDAINEDPAVIPLLDATGTDEYLDIGIRVRSYTDEVCGIDEEF